MLKTATIALAALTMSACATAKMPPYEANWTLLGEVAGKEVVLNEGLTSYRCKQRAYEYEKNNGVPAWGKYDRIVCEQNRKA